MCQGRSPLIALKHVGNPPATCSAGVLGLVAFPDEAQARADTWVESGTEVSGVSTTNEVRVCICHMAPFYLTQL
jgi:hypothetical protein